MKKQRVLGVLPARLGSTRLKRKMLLEINGKPLVYYTWKQAKKATALDEVIVATDSEEIKEAVEGFSGKVMMTSQSIKTGSERVAAAADKFKGFSPDIVINIQGDEPMMPPAAINKTANLLLEDKDAYMSTVATPFKEKSDLQDPGMVKVVLDNNGYALYFSRSIIPHERMPYEKYLNHLGIYGFKRKFLKTYLALKQTPLDKAEQLEQLRVLEHGYRIKVGVGNYNRYEVNTQEEFDKAKKFIEAK